MLAGWMWTSALIAVIPIMTRWVAMDTITGAGTAAATAAATAMTMAAPA